MAKNDSTGTHYYHQDLVSNLLTTDSSGNVYEQLGHHPYGESWYNASGDKFIFTTYERDTDPEMITPKPATMSAALAAFPRPIPSLAAPTIRSH